MAERPAGSVIITPEQMYKQIETVHHDVIETKGMVSAMAQTKDDHEDRIRTLEQRPVVTPKQIYTATILGCTVLGVIISGLTLLMTVVNN